MDIQVLLKLVLAAALGGIIGIERELAPKRGVMKACIIIAAGTALLTTIAPQFPVAATGTDPVTFTVIAHVITALGLIAAAAAMRERLPVQGLATAGVILCVGAAGILVGLGLYLTTLLAVIVLATGLLLLKNIFKSIEKQSTVFTYIISTEDRAAVMIEIKKIVLEMGLNYINANIKKHHAGFQIELVLNTSDVKNKTFIERIMQLPDVIEINSEHL